MLLGGLAYAAETEPLDEEFLEYLAELDGKEENWTWFASDRERQKMQKQPRKREQKVKP